MNNLDLYAKFQNTPEEAQKQISAGRLKGFTDINPMWRIKRLTEVFGPVGIGWKYVITDKQFVPGAEGTVAAFVEILLFYKNGSEWSDGIPGAGGSMFISREKGGMHTNDECLKMALTDAIGTACKSLGMSADIYYAKDRTKYTATEDSDDASVEEKKKLQEKYDAAISKAKQIVDGVTDAATANAAAPRLKEIPHALTSERDVNVLWNRRMKELNLFYDRILKSYTPVA